MRGELPLAQQNITVLLDHVERRGDRPALLNAMRGKAMILMFMGRFGEAWQALEQSYSAFFDINEEYRLAARAAGQYAGVADLALMSWMLWLLGRPDSAAERIDAALRRADETAHAHTQAYARYYASVLYALRDQPDIARAHAQHCFALSEAHGFRQWHGLSRAIMGICAALADNSAGTLDDVRAALDEYRRAGYQLGITALYVLLGSVLLLRGELDGASDIVERGFSTVEDNSERIFEAELCRLKAAILQRAGGAPEEVRSLLERAVRVAGEQQAKSLELRAARDLADLRRRQGGRTDAKAMLAPICQWFTEGAATRDLRDARALLAEL
jgi:tetratricopeptide (TPR) repeat protein